MLGIQQDVVPFSLSPCGSGLTKVSQVVIPLVIQTSLLKLVTS